MSDPSWSDVARCSRFDNDEPRRNDRPLRATPPSGRRRRRTCGRRRCRPTLGLKQVHVMGLRVDRDRLRAGERVHGGHDSVLSGES